MTTCWHRAQHSKTLRFHLSCHPRMFFLLTSKHSYVRLFGYTVMTLPCHFDHLYANICDKKIRLRLKLLKVMAKIRAALVRPLNILKGSMTPITVHNSAVSVGQVEFQMVSKLKNTWARSIPVRCSKFLAHIPQQRSENATCYHTPFTPVPLWCVHRLNCWY